MEASQLLKLAHFFTLLIQFLIRLNTESQIVIIKIKFFMNIDSRKKVEKTTITAASFSAKYKSKREIFNLLTVEAKAYLSSPENFTIYFLKDLISGNKKCKLYVINTHSDKSSSVVMSKFFLSLSMSLYLSRASWKNFWSTMMWPIICQKNETLINCPANG